MFELWSNDFQAGKKIEVRFFSNLVQMAAGYQPEACGMCGHCTPYPVVEGDGSVYPCDFYVTDEWRLGNVSDGFEAMLSGRRIKEFALPSETIDDACRACPHFALCRGGCRRWREPVIGGIPSINCLCDDYKLFFTKCSEAIYRMARRYLGAK
jgi:uncharacterized protein